MLLCDLELGNNVWSRLESGRLSGELSWNDAPPLPVVVRIRGAHSRRFPKKSLQIVFPEERLPDAPPEGHTVRRIHLNADYVDPTLMRSALSYTLFDWLGVPSPLCRHVALTVSGEFAGVYLAMESVDSDFCRRRGYRPGQIFYALNKNANFALISPVTKELKQPLDSGYKPVGGADTAPLRRMILDLNLASERSFPGAVERWLDVGEYLNWLMVAVFVGNRDGFVHNYALWRDPHEGIFRIIPWDYDATWGNDIHGREARLDRVPVGGWNKLSYRLLTSARYRQVYRRRFQDALNGVLSPDAVVPLIDSIGGDILPWVDMNRERWQLPGEHSTEVARLRWWAVERRRVLLQELDFL